MRVVPRRCGAVRVGHRLSLRVPMVAGVIPAGVAQVDAADVRDVLLRPAGVPDDDELLMMRAGGSHPHVQERLRARILQGFADLLVRFGGERQFVPMRAPDQPADVGAALVRTRQDRGDLTAWLPGEPLVWVPAPVGEEDQITRPRCFKPAVQLSEVRRSMDQRTGPVPG